MTAKPKPNERNSFPTTKLPPVNWRPKQLVWRWGQGPTRLVYEPREEKAARVHLIQVGWIADTGRMYSLDDDDDPAEHEYGKYFPLYMSVDDTTNPGNSHMRRHLKIKC